MEIIDLRYPNEKVILSEPTMARYVNALEKAELLLMDPSWRKVKGKVGPTGTAWNHWEMAEVRGKRFIRGGFLAEEMKVG